jgi:hypothetical protein
MMRPTACRKRDPQMMVAYFLHNTSATWRIELLEEWFLPMDIEIIISIPLTTRRMEDFWAWQYEENGLLTIRSVYRMLVQTKKRREDWLEGRSASSNSEDEAKSWLRLWKIEVPSKLRVFLWRLDHQSPPTGDIRCHCH